MSAEDRPAVEGPLLSVVVPVFNEAASVEILIERLRTVLEPLPLDWRVLFVDDGSTDGTAAALEGLRAADPRLGWLRLSRNFGKEVAMTAGLDRAEGDAVIIIDADLQDPPELIPQLIERWRDGYDVVYAQRTARAGERWLKRATAAAFYRLINRVSDTPIPPDTGDYRLLSRRAVDALGGLRERHRFMKGLYSWVGFRQVAVPYRREPRHAGKSKFGYWRLWNFAVDGITSFTSAPLKFATYLGLAAAVTALSYGVVVIAKTLMFGDPVRGYPSMMAVILFLGGVQLIALGIIGEYLGRLFDEAKQRPLYLVDDYRAPAGTETAPRESTPAR